MTVNSSTNPLVSVVMPTYDHGLFIGEAIESVLGQTYGNLELIVIDNYSSDNTELIVASHSDKRVRYLKFRNNGVVAASRNVGVRESKGEYVAFLDSDDIWLREKLELQVNTMLRRNDVGLVCTRAKVFGETGRAPCNRPTLAAPSQQEFSFKNILVRNPVVGSTAMVRKTCLEDVGLLDESPEIRTAEDVELWLRIAGKYRIVCLNAVLAGYRLHASNLSRDETRQVRAWFSAVRKIHEKIGISNALRARARTRYNYLLARAYVVQGDARKLAELRSAAGTDRLDAPTRLLLTLSAIGGLGLARAAIGAGHVLARVRAGRFFFKC